MENGKAGQHLNVRNISSTFWGLTASTTTSAVRATSKTFEALHTRGNSESLAPRTEESCHATTLSQITSMKKSTT